MSPTLRVNSTMTKFGHPTTLVKEYDHWVVQVRPAQVTLGSLVLVCRQRAEAFGDISAGAFAELRTVIGEIERTLAALWSFDRINYLMLMMVDKDVHFHVIPRYGEERSFGAEQFADAGWPGPPDLASANTLKDEAIEAIAGHLRDNWAG